MADNIISSERRRHAVMMPIKAKHRNFEIARFLKVLISFVSKVGRELLDENNGDELVATGQEKRALLMLF
ncbi:unnamed protein product [Hymenolepis diminuta]|uniref:Uncharacterized protein n=1 Tax=Hymenolepis diminuta TaxID=6216 RepID=A0A564Y0V9_HYMDI|nr:unnamed protein product [Hymenolepis diminuta]